MATSLSRRAALMLIPLAAACGGNVVVDGAGGASSTHATTTGATGCTSDLDCASGEVCDVSTGTCAADATCMTDSDCPAGEACNTVFGMCQTASADDCVNDSQCPPGDVCDLTTGLCGPEVPPNSCHQCACVDLLSEGGCANVCDSKQNGTNTPNFCNGVDALPQCAKCLADNCASAGANPSDPTGCN